MIEQKTLEWKRQRMGRFTGSEIYRLMTEPRTKADRELGLLSSGAKTYVLEKASEVITGHLLPDIGNKYTEHGELYEPEARTYFELEHDKIVIEAEFIPYGEYGGASTDGEVQDEDAIVEIKCPFNQHKHLEYLLLDADEIKSKLPQYYWQMQNNMMVTGTSKCYFISYHPHFTGDMRMRVIEVPYNVEDGERIKAKVKKAGEELSEITSKLKKAA